MRADPGDLELGVAKASALAGLLQHVGYAIWQAAECEDMLANWVTISLRPTRGIGEEAALPIMRQVQRRSLGQLLGELREGAVLERPLIDRLDHLVKERNWLVHHAKRENRRVLNAPDRLDGLLQRIDRIATEATELNTILGRKFEERVVAAGVDPAYIEQEARRLQREWGYAEGLVSRVDVS